MKQLEPITDRNADRIVLLVGAVLFCILLAFCSAIPSPEPALPHCRADRAVHERCQP